jgi:hypothetical protein
MKKLVVPGLIITLYLIFSISCYYDNEEMLYPDLNGSCDTSNVTFSTTIAPILNNNCLSCHSDANAAFGGGVRLQSLADVQASSAKIMPAIDQTGPKPMPPSGKLKPCAVTQFRIWIRNGTPAK